MAWADEGSAEENVRGSRLTTEVLARGVRVTMAAECALWASVAADGRDRRSALLFEQLGAERTGHNGGKARLSIAQILRACSSGHRLMNGLRAVVVE